MGPIENVDWSSGGIVRQFKMKYTETNNIRFLKPSKNSYFGIDGVAIHMSAILPTIINADGCLSLQPVPDALRTEDDWSAEDHGPTLGCE